MRIHLHNLLGLTLVVLSVAQAHAAMEPYYNPHNAASPTGFTIGYELFRTIGCPGKALLDAPCGLPAPTAVAAAEPVPAAAPAEPVREAATEAPAPATPAVPAARQGVNFAFDSAQLEAQAEPVLDQAAAELRASSYPPVRLDGYTDAIGPAAYNVELSVRRARSVKQYLVGQGVPETSLMVDGHGETDFVAGNDTKAGRRENRRVELHVVNQG